MEDELKRLEEIKLRIEWAKSNEDNFDEMYQLMQKEYPDLDTNKATIFKEARVYIGGKKSRPNDKEQNMSNYHEFLSDFKSFIFGKIQRIKHEPGIPIK